MSACAVHAAADRFDYDSAGRLIRRVDDQSRGTDYVYDPAGNVLQVGAPGQALPPSITSGPLPDQRRNEVRLVAVGGSGLAGVAIKTSHPGIIVTHVVQSTSAMSFRLAVSGQVPLGHQELLLQGAVGTVQLPFNVLPPLAFSFDPYPIGVPPDNIARRVTLHLGEPPTQTRTYSLSSLSPATARTSVNQITVSPGQTQAEFGVAGIAEGSSVLRLGSTDLFEPVEALISVYPGAGNRIAYSPALQVSRGLPSALGTSASMLSQPISIRRGTPPWSELSRATFSSSLVIQRSGRPWAIDVTDTRSALTIRRWVPWATSSTAGFVLSGPVQLVRQ